MADYKYNNQKNGFFIQYSKSDKVNSIYHKSFKVSDNYYEIRDCYNTIKYYPVSKHNIYSLEEFVNKIISTEVGEETPFKRYCRINNVN